MTLSPKLRAVVAHVVITFAVAFVGQVGAGLSGAVHMPTLVALVTSAVAAGASAVVHHLVGLVPPAPAPVAGAAPPLAATSPAAGGTTSAKA
jgi:hypothetical protein